MPQELQVLRCYYCNFFQVHIVKKSRKWECKICSEKQSIKKVYGRGSGRDCRVHVQQLNKLAAMQQENQIANYGGSLQSDYVPEGDVQSVQTAASSDVQNYLRNPSAGSSSKWSVFLDKPENEDSNEEECSEAAKQKFRVCQYSDSFQNVGGLLSSGGVSEETETPLINKQLTASRKEKCQQTHKIYLNNTSNSYISSFNNGSDSWNTYENVQDVSGYKAPKSNWPKNVGEARNFLNDDDMKQLSDNLSPHSKKPKISICDTSIHMESSNKWHKYLEEPTIEALSSKYAEVPSLISKKKMAVPISASDITQDTQEPGFISESEEQILYKREITTSLNAASRDQIESCSSNTFSREYDEEELNDILDL